MSNQVLNLFPISNLQQLSCKYHLLEVKNLPRNTMFSENLERLATMAAKERRSPVSIFHEDQRTYLATTADPASNWDLRVGGPNGFERSDSLSGAAGEHDPELIRKLILRLAPSAAQP